MVTPLDSLSALKRKMSVLLSRRARVIICQSCTAFLGMSKTWGRSSWCLKTSISSSTCTFPPNLVIFLMLPLKSQEREELESIRLRVSLPGMLAWPRLLRVEGWRGKEGCCDFRVIFRDSSPRNSWSSKEMLKTWKACLVEPESWASFHSY